MLLNPELETHARYVNTPRLVWAQRLEAGARIALRYGLVALMLLWGAMKFTDMEAEGIRPLVEHSPLLSWLYAVAGVRGGSALIGIIELSAAALICMRRFRPFLSAIGSLMAVGTFLVTLSFLITTPGIWEPTNPFGGFIMKDLLFLAAALWCSADALRASATP